MKRKEKKNLMREGRVFESVFKGGEYIYKACDCGCNDFCAYNKAGMFSPREITDEEWQSMTLVKKERPFKKMLAYVMAELMQKHGKVLEFESGGTCVYDQRAGGSFLYISSGGVKVNMSTAWAIPCRVQETPPKPKTKMETRYRFAFKSPLYPEGELSTHYYRNMGHFRKMNPYTTDAIMLMRYDKEFEVEI